VPDWGWAVQQARNLAWTWDRLGTLAFLVQDRDPVFSR
jgi:hypothetical protein